MKSWSPNDTTGKKNAAIWYIFGQRVFDILAHDKIGISLNMIQYILFDFDGTLVDSREAIVAAFNKLAPKYNLKKIEQEDLEYINQLSMIDRFRFLNVPLYRIPFLRTELISLYKQHIASVSMVPGIAAVLQKLTDKGVKIGIASSNAPSVIKAVTGKNGVLNISDIYCSREFFGKERMFKKFLKEKKLAASEALYVCDERRDIIACNKARIQPIWVTWGFETKEIVKGCGPFVTANTPEELYNIVEQAIGSTI